MSITGTIRRSDRGPLGGAEDVKRHLSDAFPGVEFTFAASEPPAAAEIRARLISTLRLPSRPFSACTRYPHHHGHWEPGTGAIVQFYFDAAAPVRSIEATSYGMTGDLDANFDRLCAATGWTVVYEP
jgi:hypothetical protein